MSLKKNMKFRKRELKIAIDGSAATGKSFVSKKISKILKINVLNTGMIYRIATLYLIKNDSLFLENEELSKKLSNLKFYFLFGKVFTNFIYKKSELFTEEVTKNVKFVANNKYGREAILPFQKKVAKKRRIIIEGRDIGTIIMPNANYKFYLEVKPEIAAKRRMEQMKNNNSNNEKSYNEILQNINIRNKNDKNRDFSPLKIPKDSVIIDTSNLTKKEVVNSLINIIKNKGKNE